MFTNSKIRKISALFIVLLIVMQISQMSPALAEEPSGERWVLEFTDSPDLSEEFRQSLDNDLGYEVGSVDLDAGIVTYNYHKEKDGTVLHDYVIETVFSKPPEELIPGQTIELNLFNRVISNSKEAINVGARYYFSVRDSNAGELARADIDLSTPSATLTFQVPEVNNGELVIFFNNQFFHDLGVEWRYRAGESATIEIIDEVDDLKEPVITSHEEFSISRSMQGKFDAISGDVEILRSGETQWVSVKEGDVFIPGDRIRTLDESIVRIYVLDDDSWAGLEAGANTEITIDELTVDEKEGRTSLFSMYRGAVRWFTERGWGKGFGGNGIFRVTPSHGAALVSTIRGSDVIIIHEPDSGTTEIYVNEGNLSLQNTMTGDNKELKAGQMVIVVKSNIHEVQPLSQKEWDAQVEQNRLENDEAISIHVGADEDDTQVDGSKDEDIDPTQNSSSQSVIFGVIIGVVVIAILFFGIRKMRTKGAHN